MANICRISKVSNKVKITTYEHKGTHIMRETYVELEVKDFDTENFELVSMFPVRLPLHCDEVSSLDFTSYEQRDFGKTLQEIIYMPFSVLYFNY